ncbi:MAG: hypothetical protein BWK80_45025 [Desulfobacteraceae bacterium IS3]|nr:MAG: hypothetical protein BWK80_45025 [Desulfobacteraceae bacterium IS3]
MRERAEKEIREAAASLGKMERYRIDRVRERTTLIRKVFDKTLLDMARVGTVHLAEGNASEMDSYEISNLIRQGDAVYVSFSFVDAEPAAQGIETMNVMLKGFNRADWELFEYFCETREGKKGVQKLSEMIIEYNRREI